MTTTTDINPDTGRPFTTFEASAQTRVQNQGKPGFDVLGDPTSGTPSPYVPTSGSINRSIDPNAAAAEGYLSTFTPPETADQIAERKRKQSQTLIDSINKQKDDEVVAAQRTGQERLNMDNAVSVLSGLSGSTEAARTRGTVLDKNDKEVQAINNERAVAVQTIFAQISKDASDEALKQREDATKSAQDIVARRTATQTKAVDNLKLLASGGLIDFTTFKNSPQDAQTYQYALDAVGGSEDNLRAIFAMNRPKDQLVGTPQRVGDHFVQAYQNPITGKVSYDTISVPGGLPPTYNSFQKIGDSKTGEFLYAVPDNWDGDQSKLKLVASTRGVGNGSGSGNGGYNGEFGQTIELAGGLAGSVYAQKALKDQLKAAIAAKDYPSAYAGIVQATSHGLSGENKTKFENAAIDQTLLNNMATKLKAYQDAGGDMNIFKGTVDDIGKRIGVLTNDPKYASVATELDRAFQQYRQNMTGAAFSPQESAEYAKVVPGKGKSIDLNLATIEGALSYANNYVEGAIRSKTGEGGIYIKQYAEGAQPGAQSATGGDLASEVAAKGYDYAKMKADGHSDADIKAALGL